MDCECVSSACSPTPLSLSFRRIWSWEVDAHQLALPDRPVLPWVPRPFTQNQKNCAGDTHLFIYLFILPLFHECFATLYFTCRVYILYIAWLCHIYAAVTCKWAGVCELMCADALCPSSTSSPGFSVSLVVLVFLPSAPEQTFTPNLHTVAFYIISSRSIDALSGTFLWGVCVLFKRLKMTTDWKVCVGIHISWQEKNNILMVLKMNWWTDLMDNLNGVICGVTIWLLQCWQFHC